MAWISTTADAEKIDIEPDNTRDLAGYSYTSDALISYTVAIEVRSYKYQYQGVTKTVALDIITKTYLAPIQTNDGIVAEGTEGVVATAQWRGDGGYNVNITINQKTFTETAV